MHWGGVDAAAPDVSKPSLFAALRPRLAPREQHLLDLWLAGCDSQAECASLLGVSSRAVRRSLARIRLVASELRE